MDFDKPQKTGTVKKYLQETAGEVGIVYKKLLGGRDSDTKKWGKNKAAQL